MQLNVCRCGGPVIAMRFDPIAEPLAKNVPRRTPLARTYRVYPSFENPGTGTSRAPFGTSRAGFRVSRRKHGASCERDGVYRYALKVDPDSSTEHT